MTVLTEHQERLRDAVGTTFEEVHTAVRKMEDEYDYAAYRAKAPLRSAVERALEAGVPYKQIVEATRTFDYPQKLKTFMEPSVRLAERLAGGDVATQAGNKLAEGVDAVQSVVRDPRTGMFVVVFEGREYKVGSFGPDDEPWSNRDADIPQHIYDLISASYPAFVVLEDED